MSPCHFPANIREMKLSDAAELYSSRVTRGVTTLYGVGASIVLLLFLA